MNIPAYGYLRVSGIGQKDGDGFRRQHDAIADYAARNDLEMRQFYFDAYTGGEEDRPSYMAMMEDVLGNGVKTIVVECMDRFARDSMVQAMLLSKLVAAEITLISAVTGENISARMANRDEDPMMWAMVQIQGVFAELEKRLLVRRMRAARQKKRLETGKCEGRQHYGEKDPREKEILDYIVDLHVNGRVSIREIATRLNRENIWPRRAKQWSASTVHGILNRVLG